MADHPSSPALRKPQTKRGSPNLQNRGAGTTRGRGHHGTPFKPNVANSGQANDQNRRGGHGRSNRGNSARGQGKGRILSENTPARPLQSPFAQPAPSTQSVLTTSPSPDEIRQADLDREHLAAHREKVHARYVDLRKTAIENKLMDDPNRRKKLQDSIRRIGICEQMCDEKERVDRIFENLVDLAETEPHPETQKPVPIQGKMVKRFRRAAAGDPDQQLEELRTPSTLRQTMDYLVRNVISSDSRLPQVHKFVWDRTRAIRNDFTIQNFSNPEDVKQEVGCYERIARFHILSMHQMVNPDHMRPDEHYDGQQDLEQLNKTILTLLTKYDDFRHVLDFPNEAEFRAYFILIEMRNSASDIEDRVQRWQPHILNDGRVQTALKLYIAACSTDQRYGTLGAPIPVAMAQANSGRFWTLLDSLQVSYLMACTAEMSFFNVRFTALNALWAATKNASKSNQSSLRFWTRAALEHYLGFDDEDQAGDFCRELGLSFAKKVDPNTGEDDEYLDFTLSDAQSLDKHLLSMTQIFSEGIVERKRHDRTLYAVINGMSVAESKRAGQVEIPIDSTDDKAEAKQHSLFVNDDDEDDEFESDGEAGLDKTTVHSMLNPGAVTFIPETRAQAAESTTPSIQTTQQPRWMTHFGQSRSPDSASPGELPKDIFAPVKETTSPSLSPFTSLTPTSPFRATHENPLTSKLFQPPATNVNNPDFNDLNHDSGVVTKGFNELNNLLPTSTNGDVPHSSKHVNPFSNHPDQVESSKKLNPLSNFDASALSETKSSQNLETSGSSGETPATIFVPASQVTSPPSDKNQFSFHITAATSQNFQLSSFSSPVTSATTNSKSKSPTTNPPFSFFTKPQSVESAGATLTSIAQDSSSILSAQSAPVQTPPKPAKRPPIESIQFPPVTSRRLESELVNTTVQSTVNTAEAIPRQASLSPSAHPVSFSQSQPFLVKSTSIPPVVKPETEESKTNPEQLLHHLVRLGLVQENGIIDMFVSHKVSNIVRDVFNRFRRQQVDDRIFAIREQVLRRKFFVLWRNIAESRRLRRQAKRRRARLAASMKIDAERKRQKALELAEIYEADRITRIIQRQQRRTKLKELMEQDTLKDEEKEREIEQARDRAQTMEEKSSSIAGASVAGQKRKTPANGAFVGPLNDAPAGPLHKRSRTLGTSSEESPSVVSSLLARSRDFDDYNLRRPLREGRQKKLEEGEYLDETKTDYFRLIAYGIDPKTPLTPLTKAQINEQAKFKAEKRAATIARISKGRGPWAPKANGNAAASTSAEASSPLEEVPFNHTEEIPKRSTFAFNPEENPLIKKIREAKQALADDTEWFKEQTAILAKEIEQEEEHRRSLSQSQSTASSFGVSANGLARSLSGYEYFPLTPQSGQTLSRTEQRIQITGARGLATKPPGLSPKPKYTPVAMSKRSALGYSQEIGHDNRSSRAGNRNVDEIEQINGVDVHPVTARSNKVLVSSQQITKKPRTEESCVSSFGYIVSPDYTTQETGNKYEEDDENQEVNEELNTNEGSFHENDVYLDQQELSEDEEDEVDDEAEYDEADNVEEDADDEETYDDDPQAHGPPLTSNDYGSSDWQDYEQEETDGDEDDIYPQPFGYGALQIPTTFSRHGSQALSGVATPDTGAGASADDAIELSD